jgi:signal transduction histidine kinase
VPVALTTEGMPSTVPTGLELAAYRVVQEALTNVIKHAPGARTTVAVRHLPDAVEVEVRSAAPVPGPVVPGQGMRGMAERVALYDGRFTAAPGSDGFRVTATFPLAEPATEAGRPAPTGADAEAGP